MNDAPSQGWPRRGAPENDRVAVVTGAASGIGRAIAERLESDGVSVVAADLSPDEDGGTLVNPIADPVSGEPEFKHTPARVMPFSVRWHGFVLARNHIVYAHSE